MASKLPAFGRPLQAAIISGREPRDIVVFIDRWPPRKTAAKRPALAVLPGDDPGALNWSACRGRNVIVPGADEVPHDRLIATCRAIRAASPLRLLLLKDEAPGFELIVSRGGAT